MSQVFIVIGMHRSGTSLVSSLLHTGGISMCRYRCDKGDPSQPNGYFEDHDFVVLNRLLLRGAKGNWHQPPSPEVLRVSGSEMYESMGELIQKRAKKHPKWGFKDPRTALCLYQWHKVLKGLNHKPRYIYCLRDQTGVIESLLRRNGKTLAEHAALYNEYNQRAQAFLSRFRGSYTTVHFDDLVKTNTEREVEKLAKFCGCESEINQMLPIVQRR